MPKIDLTTEPENAYLRIVLRSLAAQLEMLLPADGGHSRIVTDMRAMIRTALERPRTNDPAIDALERRVGDLESRLIDQQVLLRERATAEFRAGEAERQRQAAISELGAVRAAIRPRARPAAPGEGAQPDARYLAELGAKIRIRAEYGVQIDRAQAADIESELLEIAAGLNTMEQRATIEQHAIEAAADRERLLYWLCWCVREMTDPDAHKSSALLDAVLEEFGYDDARVQQMLERGEPARRSSDLCPARYVGVGMRPLADGVTYPDAHRCMRPKHDGGQHRWRCGRCHRLCGDAKALTIWLEDNQGVSHAFRAADVHGETATNHSMCKEQP
jgi:hypothetical protein